MVFAYLGIAYPSACERFLEVLPLAFQWFLFPDFAGHLFEFRGTFLFGWAGFPRKIFHVDWREYEKRARRSLDKPKQGFY
jgi:hypothetical protein